MYLKKDVYMNTCGPTQTERKTADYLVRHLPEIINKHPGSDVFFESDETGAIIQHTYDDAVAKDWQPRNGPCTVPQISDYVFLEDGMKDFMVGNGLLPKWPAEWVLQHLRNKKGG